MDEGQDERLADALEGQHAAAEEVALPERDRMPLQEVVPGGFAALRSRIEAHRLEDVLDRVPRRRLDSQLLELSHDPGVAPVILARQLADQPAQLLGRAPAVVRPRGLVHVGRAAASRRIGGGLVTERAAQ